MICFLAAILLFFQLPPIPGLGELFNHGVTFGFAILFWYALMSSNKEHREDVRKIQDAHQVVIDKMHEDTRRREERMVGVLEKNAEHIARLVDVAERMNTERWCPLQSETARR